VSHVPRAADRLEPGRGAGAVTDGKIDWEPALALRLITVPTHGHQSR